eukprot:TRINITY_DN1881_c0_g3_i1.p1 TRINITY_DN1881_c0_g3~~TRINITY_DN1881_c0_g3_i1.p1  ORF type:complete len:230 (+),score=9.52 TRINITY_DN1881_c0_g3_i1:57-746(+)
MSCSICYGTAKEGTLISPCKCKGSLEWVHEECLQNWRKEAPDCSRCSICKYEYQMGTVGVLKWTLAVLKEVSRWIYTGAAFSLSFEVGKQVAVQCNSVGKRWFGSLLRRHSIPEVAVMELIVKSAIYATVETVCFAHLSDQLSLLSLQYGQFSLLSVKSTISHMLFITSLQYGFGKLGTTIGDYLDNIQFIVALSGAFFVIPDIYKRIVRDALAKQPIICFKQKTWSSA